MSYLFIILVITIGLILAYFRSKDVKRIIYKKQIPAKSAAYFELNGLAYVFVSYWKVNNVNYFQYRVVFDDSIAKHSKYYLNVKQCLDGGINELKTHKNQGGDCLNISGGRVGYYEPFKSRYSAG